MNLNFADGRVRLMGILNVTPDSFSDGGENFAPGDAIASARRMIADGADIIDIGAESTRPYGGAAPVDVKTEIARLAPVLPKVIEFGVPVSIDTMKAEVAEYALDQGAMIINDVWGLQRDPGMAKLAARLNVPIIAMHNRKEAQDGIDIMTDMHAFFARTFEIAQAAGLAREKLILDPGIGFGKTFEQNLIVLKNMDQLKRYGLPVLVGASRKVFIGKISGAEPQQRGPGTIAAHFEAVKRGATILRVHNVAEMRQALSVVEAINNA